MLIPRIVVVEQDDSQRLLYKWEFEDEGYEVTCCGKLEDTASIAARKPTDLVLMDGGSCRSAAGARARQARSIFGAVPLVVHTASLYSTQEGHLESADAFLPKSTDLTGLKHTVRSLLPGSRKSSLHNPAHRAVRGLRRKRRDRSREQTIFEKARGKERGREAVAATDSTGSGAGDLLRRDGLPA